MLKQVVLYVRAFGLENLGEKRKYEPKPAAPESAAEELVEPEDE